MGKEQTSKGEGRARAGLILLGLAVYSLLAFQFPLAFFFLLVGVGLVVVGMVSMARGHREGGEELPGSFSEDELRELFGLSPRPQTRAR